MTITKDQLARDLVESTGYYLKDVKTVLSAMDDLIKGYFAQVTDDNEISVQIVEGVKLTAKVVQPRDRVDPRTQEAIRCGCTVKTMAKFSDKFKKDAQVAYDKKGK